ncbi:hypothetical protein ACWCYZ_38980 [Streptomyces virginiae]
MDTEKHQEDAEVTAIIAQKVLPGREREYETWQQGVNAAAEYDGYLGVEVTPPTPLQPEWVVVYRYDSVPTCRRGSTARPGRDSSKSATSTSTAPEPSRWSAATRPHRIRW